MDALLNSAEHVFLNMARLWAESSSDQKERLQKTLFPPGVRFDRAAIGTDVACCLLSALSHATGEKLALVPLAQLSFNRIIDWLRQLDLRRAGQLDAENGPLRNLDADRQAPLPA